jgi:urease accessory protein
MERDASAGRKGRPHLFTDMRRGAGIEDVVAFIEETGGLRAATAAQ